MGTTILSDLISKHPLGETNASKSSQQPLPVITSPKAAENVLVCIAFLSAPFKLPLPALSQSGGSTGQEQAGAAHVSWSRMLTPQQQLACWIISCRICSHLDTACRKAWACSPKPWLFARVLACLLPDRTAAAP